MAKPLPYTLPSFKINKVETTLEKNGKIYARLIRGVDRNKRAIVMRERTSIEVEKYTDKPIECVVEIVKARLFTIDPEEKKKTSTRSRKSYFRRLGNRL